MKAIACVPGEWADRAAFLHSIIESSDGRFMFAGGILYSTADKTHVEIEIHEHDPRMGEAFAMGAEGRLSAVERTAIEQHQSVLYLHSEHTGLDDLHLFHRFIGACLDAGGLGVKFENSGAAHSAATWRGYKFHDDTLALLRSHVMLIAGEHHFFSCGMHIFRLPDVAVACSIDNKTAGYLLTEFNHYHLFEGPEFADGHTFTPDKDSPRYVLRFRDDFIYGGEALLENPFGRIELVA